MTDDELRDFRAHVTREIDALRDLINSSVDRHDQTDTWLDIIRPRVDDLHSAIHEPPMDLARRMASGEGRMDAMRDQMNRPTTDWRAQLAEALSKPLAAIRDLRTGTQFLLVVCVILVVMLVTGTSVAELLGFDPRGEIEAETAQTEALEDAADALEEIADEDELLAPEPFPPEASGDIPEMP